MSSQSVKKFIQLLHRSQLVSDARLKAALSDRESGGRLPHDARTLANFLTQQGLLTSWQQKRLLSGKQHGYFLGDYCLQRHLGSGGMSSVFLAKHRLINRTVAIKVLPSKRIGEGSYLARFEREAQATSRLSHPNVVRVFDIDHHGDTHFMVMEYVAGSDLKAMVKSTGPLPLDRVAHYIAQVAVGLQHAHERGLVHRDIKPANLVVNEADVVKILDLGLARIVDSEEVASLTIDNAEKMMGTADYLSPEQARSAHSVDARADLYSLGCTMYYLLSGHAPFTEGTIAQRILMHQTQNPLDVRACREDCPHAIADLCMKMLAKTPDDRIQSAGTIAVRLGRWLQANDLSRANSTYAGFAKTPLPSRTIFASPSPSLDPPVTVDAESPSLTSTRKARNNPKMKTPASLWLFLALLLLICTGLVILVVWKQ